MISWLPANMLTADNCWLWWWTVIANQWFYIKLQCATQCATQCAIKVLKQRGIQKPVQNAFKENAAIKPASGKLQDSGMSVLLHPSFGKVLLEDAVAPRQQISELGFELLICEGCSLGLREPACSRTPQQVRTAFHLLHNFVRIGHSLLQTAKHIGIQSVFSTVRSAL